jgi:hypothetical protein
MNYIKSVERIFVPHNIYFKERSEQLSQALTNIDKNIEDLKNIEYYNEPMIQKLAYQKAIE